MGEDELRHYGVKGMKWGVRRTPAQLGHIIRRSGRTSMPGKKGAAKKTASSSKAAAPQKKVSDLTDDEIRKRISRLELEKRYRELSKDEEKKKTNRGKKFCTDVLETIGKNTLTNLGTQAANHIIGDAINKIAGVSSSDAAHRIVNPQRGQT